MARTGYLVIIYQDINPSSPTYNQTREERTQDEENCPSSSEAHWIEDTKYCELTENGMLTGYEITVYRDVEPLSSTYNQTREERELNPTECEANEYTPNWQNIGEPFCRQMVYLPGGLMGNDGYMIQQQQDMNEYSETADEIREIETLDLENCPLPNTEPVWQIISESCHLVMYQGELVYDGTKDVVRVNTNQYSPTWNNNIPETANVQDPINCPSEIQVQYRWITISDEFVCDGYDKYSLLKKQQSTDGGTTWTDVTPLETNTGYLIEENSEDCGYEPPTPPSTQYRWVTVSETYQCMGYDKYTVEKKQQSTDGGTTWTDVSPLETRAGEIIEVNSVDCGYVPPIQYRWVVVSGQTECVGYDKYSVEKKQQSTDGGTTWTDVTPTETRTGSVIEYNSEDCGYPPVPIQYRWIVVSGEYICVGYDKYTKEKKQQSTDGGTTWTDVSPSETRAGQLVEANSQYCGYVPPTPSYETQYLTFEALEDGTFSFTNAVQYTIDNGATWTTLNANTASPTVTRGNKIMWKAEITPSWPSGVGTFSSSGRYNVEGNPMSLIYGDNFIGQTSLSGKTGVFFYLFKDNNYLISASNMKLVATTLSDSCYRAMFSYCTSLTAAPELPATTLADYCYGFMFRGCSSLTTAPSLPATTLAQSCYSSMFNSCTSLVNAPSILPATTLAKRCYDSMFMECTSLRIAPELPATNFTNISDTSANNGYEYIQMFSNCTSLVYLKAMFVDYGYLNVYNWMSNIHTNGTFVKNPNATWTVPPQMPTTWTIITE